MSKKDFLLEIGVEELPASFVRSALEGMVRDFESLLSSYRLTAETVSPLGTPRRISIFAQGLSSQQTDLKETVMGPPAKIAMDESGQLSKAGEGFARKNNIDPSLVKVIETPKGPYVGFERDEKGRPAEQILAALLCELCAKIPFPKSMRWGYSTVAFGRPIHWIVSLLGTEIVPFDFAGIEASNQSIGHRFLSSDVFEIPSAEQYMSLLEKKHVWVDATTRTQKMIHALKAEAEKLGGEWVEDRFLVEECSLLVEEPFVVPGNFSEDFLALPEAVIVSVMRDHQRYFAVKSKPSKDKKTERLLPHYLNVVNTALKPELISKGNDRVLRARLKDAQFFVEEDLKHSLQSRVKRLDAVVFQAKLGTLGDKVRRIISLSSSIREHWDNSVDASLVSKAAELCKADLETLIVGEFPELQGEMGAWYAEKEGLPTEVSQCISEHYKPKGAKDSVQQADVSAMVALADRADTLVGCFGAGIVPTGSADPFALRRAALGIVRIGLEGPSDFSIQQLLINSVDLYHQTLDEKRKSKFESKEALLEKLNEFIRGRLRAFYKEHYPLDLIDACLSAWDGASVRNIEKRIQALDAFRKMKEYELLATAFKRVFNITKEVESCSVEESLLKEDAEKALFKEFENIQSSVDDAVSKSDYTQALSLIANGLKDPIDLFFKEVLVMAEDVQVQRNRLGLLKQISNLLTQIAHFHHLSPSVK